MHVAYARHFAHRAPAAFQPLGRRLLTGTGTISLNVYTYTGQPEVNAEADWWVFGSASYETGHGYTNASGHVDLTGIPAASTQNGEIAIYPVPVNATDNGWYDLYNMSWPDTGFNGGLQPGGCRSPWSATTPSGPARRPLASVSGRRTRVVRPIWRPRR